MAMNQVIRKAHTRKKLLDGIGWIDKEKSKRTGKECIATQHATARSCFETWAKDDELGNNRKFDKETIKLNMLHQRNDPYKGQNGAGTQEYDGGMGTALYKLNLALSFRASHKACLSA